LQVSTNEDDEYAALSSEYVDLLPLIRRGKVCSDSNSNEDSKLEFNIYEDFDWFAIDSD
jgi:hypothetical protein